MTDRRSFLKAAGIGATSLLAGCGWDGGKTVKPALLSISRLNDWVGEHLLFSPSRIAKNYDPSRRSAGLPAYFISDTVPMLQDPGVAAVRRRIGADALEPHARR